ncbi:MAG TPA: hypothetical protein VJL56_04365 [Candidatus Bathyarchaeia archaeon]|nr:hypothetical protein [Candidatus Bathyarchaeia archaeon]
MSTVKIQGALQTPKHVRALLSGGLGVFSSLLAIGWGLWAYNLPSAVNVTSSQSQNLMLAQLALAFIMLLESGLMLATFTLPGGIINILGALATFLIGVYFSSGIADAARSKDLTALPLRFSGVYTGTVSLATDRIVSTFLIVPVFPITALLLTSGLGALATYRSGRRATI